jgi:hypothetical protein
MTLREMVEYLVGSEGLMGLADETYKVVSVEKCTDHDRDVTEKLGFM